MKDFNYHCPGSAADAQKLFLGAEEAAYISGGMTLLPTMKQGLAAPSDLIDLGGLRNVGVSASTDKVTIKAGTTHYDVSVNEQVARLIPGLSRLASEIGDPAVRNRGTLGGSIANNDPAADYPAACLGLAACIRTNTREIAAEDFFLGTFTTALEPFEIVLEVDFPIPLKSGYAKFPNPASRYAVVGVFVAQHRDGSARVAVTGAGPGAFRVLEMEQALSVDFSSKALNGISVPANGLNEDMHATARHRAHLISIMGRRALDEAR